MHYQYKNIYTVNQSKIIVGMTKIIAKRKTSSYVSIV